MVDIESGQICVKSQLVSVSSNLALALALSLSLSLTLVKREIIAGGSWENQIAIW